MIHIRPISDLRNKFNEIEKTVHEGSPVYLTKNGYGTMVVLSIEDYSSLINDVETKLDEADQYASHSTKTLTHEEVFGSIRGKLNGR